jgi:hypothetical protein
MSILTLLLMVVLVMTQPRGGSAPKAGSKPASGKRPSTAGERVVTLHPNPNGSRKQAYILQPGPVPWTLRGTLITGCLMLLYVPIAFLSWIGIGKPTPKNLARGPKPGEPGFKGRSAELENFLEARNREIARRKAEETKRGPNDPVH